MNNQNSKESFRQAQVHIPGGVNSPVRAFRAVGGQPIFMKSARGAYMIDVDGNQYIDLINSWGPMILGHGHSVVEDAVVKAVSSSLSFGAPTQAEVTMADLICEMMPSIEMVRMVNSGTEATMSAVRLARGYTGRDKMLKFEGCYHGHGDSFLIAAGSGVATLGQPDSPGVTKGTAQDTLTVPYNCLASINAAVENNKEQIAAIILEPIAGNMGCVLPEAEYLQGIREICDREGIVLIFDEVMTGFRISKGGAQQHYGVSPDLTTLGKIIGGGMPVGAYGGKAEIMKMISPSGPIYQAGTLSGNPVAMAAGIAMLSHLNDDTNEVYSSIDATTQFIAEGIAENVKKMGLNYTVNSQGSMLSLFFTDHKVSNFDEAKKSDLEKFGAYFNEMLKRGVYLAPSQYETLFISKAISSQDAEHIVKANYESLQAIER